MRSRRVSPSPLYIMLWNSSSSSMGTSDLHRQHHIIFMARLSHPLKAKARSLLPGLTIPFLFFTCLLPASRNVPHPAPPKAHPVPHSSSPRSLPHSHPRALPAIRAKPPDAPCPLPHGQ